MIQTFVINDPAADPCDDLARCAEAIRLSGWWQTLGIDEHWPLTDAEAADLLATAGEYDIDEPRLVEFVARGIVAPPGVDADGNREWNADDVIRASKELEFRWQWRTCPSFHDFKKHPSMLAVEAVRRDDLVEAVVANPAGGQPRYDTRHLLALLVATPSVEGRVKLANLMRMTLEADQGVVI